MVPVDAHSNLRNIIFMVSFQIQIQACHVFVKFSYGHPSKILHLTPHPTSLQPSLSYPIISMSKQKLCHYALSLSRPVGPSSSVAYLLQGQEMAQCISTTLDKGNHHHRSRFGRKFSATFKEYRGSCHNYMPDDVYEL
ncbi:hypothetical protein CR513_00314, partial [Mucuna pruriens]